MHEEQPGDQCGWGREARGEWEEGGGGEPAVRRGQRQAEYKLIGFFMDLAFTL